MLQPVPVLLPEPVLALELVPVPVLDPVVVVLVELLPVVLDSPPVPPVPVAELVSEVLVPEPPAPPVPVVSLPQLVVASPTTSSDTPVINVTYFERIGKFLLVEVQSAHAGRCSGGQPSVIAEGCQATILPR